MSEIKMTNEEIVEIQRNMLGSHVEQQEFCNRLLINISELRVSNEQLQQEKAELLEMVKSGRFLILTESKTYWKEKACELIRRLEGV
jgi:hypothetical protein